MKSHETSQLESHEITIFADFVANLGPQVILAGVPREFATAAGAAA